MNREDNLNQTAKREVTAHGVSKSGAVALFMEFWTSKGYAEHQRSYNRLVLRRSGYGTFKTWIKLQASPGWPTWSHVPMELMALVQIRPDLAKYEMQFVAPATCGVAGDFLEFLGNEIAEFESFIKDWTTALGRQDASPPSE